jgi:hypothetical protein
MICCTRVEVIGRAAVIAALSLSACGMGGDPADPVLAEAYGQKLLLSDLRRMIPIDAPKEDSAELAQRFVDDWARERVLLKKAEENLNANQKNVDDQLRSYRESLITYAYEQALVRQKLDTNIVAEEITTYYRDNIKNFELRDNIVRVRWFKLRESDKRVLRKVEELWRSSEPNDRSELERIIAQRGSVLNDTGDDWMPFSELQLQVPIRPDNPTDWLQHHPRATAIDSVGTYFVEFLDHRLKNSTSPQAMVAQEIRSILINQRKLRLIERMREDLYQNALAKKDVELH